MANKLTEEQAELYQQGYVDARQLHCVNEGKTPSTHEYRRYTVRRLARVKGYFERGEFVEEKPIVDGVEPWLIPTTEKVEFVCQECGFIGEYGPKEGRSLYSLYLI